MVNTMLYYPLEELEVVGFFLDSWFVKTSGLLNNTNYFGVGFFNSITLNFLIFFEIILFVFQNKRFLKIQQIHVCCLDLEVKRSIYIYWDMKYYFRYIPYVGGSFGYHPLNKKRLYRRFFIRNYISFVRDSAGSKAIRYSWFLFFTLLFTFTTNILGLTFYAYAGTGHFFLTLFLSSTTLLGALFILVYKHGLGGLIRLFVLNDVNPLLGFLVFGLEILSYCARPISLSVRLFANIAAGHMLLDMLTYFIYDSSFDIFGLAACFVLIAVGFLEVIVAVLQSYLFFSLSLLYLREALTLGE